MSITIDTNRLMKILKADTDNLINYPHKYWKNCNITKGNRYVYIDNGANVLAIAHLDTVADKSKAMYNPPTVKPVGLSDMEIFSVGLDDRLGAYLIADFLPKLGINVDVLLTTDEEIGRSTASNFTTKKEYNWMFQFDRHGYGNVVMYQYKTPDLTYMLESFGYDVQIGSFSDICSMDYLGCSGFNFGTGYVNEHSNSCRTRYSWINVCVEMFADFYRLYSALPMKYVVQKVEKVENVYGSSYWADYYNGYGTSVRGSYTKKVTYQRCSVCNISSPSDEINKHGVCEACARWIRSLDKLDPKGSEIEKDNKSTSNKEVPNGKVTHAKCGRCSKWHSIPVLNQYGMCPACAAFLKEVNADESHYA